MYWMGIKAVIQVKNKLFGICQSNKMRVLFCVFSVLLIYGVCGAPYAMEESESDSDLEPDQLYINNEGAGEYAYR